MSPKRKSIAQLVLLAAQFAALDDTHVGQGERTPANITRAILGHFRRLEPGCDATCEQVAEALGVKLYVVRKRVWELCNKCLLSRVRGPSFHRGPRDSAPHSLNDFTRRARGNRLRATYRATTEREHRLGYDRQTARGSAR
ncbi:MAG: hypothetical protein QM775_16565 [Pirellulales bacterium]